MKLRNPLPTMATPADLASMAFNGRDGRDWYKFAHAQVVAGAAILDVEPQRFADLLALFSPRVSVIRSIRFATHYVRDAVRVGDTIHGGFLHDCTRSVRAAVKHYELTGEIRGPKTLAFSKAIMGDSRAIVLDTWMGKALGVDSKRFEVKGVREPSEELIRETARLIGWTYAETQAAIWTHVVRLNGKTPGQFFITSELDGTPI